jgi:hypothetical protein
MIVILGAGVLVPDQESDRRSRGPAFEDAGQEFHLIPFLPLGTDRSPTGAPTLQFAMDPFLIRNVTGRASIDRSTDRGTMGFPESAKPIDMSETVPRHGSQN